MTAHKVLQLWSDCQFRSHRQISTCT